MRALTGKDATDSIAALQGTLDELIITRGADGAIIYKDREIAEVPAMPLSEVKDTTGAGDLFAAGYLYGRARQGDARLCGEIASACAGEIICHYGARPEANLPQLIAPLQKQTA